MSAGMGRQNLKKGRQQYIANFGSFRIVVTA
jgi:hypothetical protein